MQKYSFVIFKVNAARKFSKAKLKNVTEDVIDMFIINQTK